MAEDWDAIAAEVATALDGVGFEVTLRRRSGGAASPWQSNAYTETDYTVTVVQGAYRVRDEAGNLIRQTQRTLTVAAGVVVPERADRILMGETWHEVTAVRPLAPGGVDLLYSVDLQE